MSTPESHYQTIIALLTENNLCSEIVEELQNILKHLYTISDGDVFDKLDVLINKIDKIIENDMQNEILIQCRKLMSYLILSIVEC